MAGSPGTYENIQHVPLVVQFAWRGKNTGSVQSDSWAKNVFVEKDQDQAYSVKRPGQVVAGSLVPSGYANLQIQCLTVEQYGATAGLAAPIAISNDHYMDLLTGARGNFGSPGLGGLGWTLATNQVANAWYCSVPVNTGAISIASVTMFAILQSPWGIYIGYWRYNAGAHQMYQSFTTVDTPSGNYPLVPGIATLDNTWYVLDGLGNLWASAIGDSSTWPALNYTKVDAAIGAPVALGFVGSYVVAFGRTGTQFWYDAAISPGSPLAAVQGGLFQQGMSQFAAFSLAKTENSLLWLGTSREGAYVVFQLTGSQIQRVSNPGVERYLAAYFNVTPAPTDSASSVWIRGSTFKVSGHEFYLLSCVDPSAAAAGTGGVSLVLDLETGSWGVWTQQTALAYGEGALRVWQALATPSGVTYMPDMKSGQVLALSDTTYQDAGQPINVQIQTEGHAWGNQRTKVIAATYPLLDTVNSTVGLTWTDDDYQTFKPVQSIDTSNSKKQLVRCGSTVQRAWQLTHTDNTPMRFYELEVEVIPGAL